MGWESTKNGTPYVFLQPLKLATSNLVHKLGLGLIDTQIGFGTSLLKTTFRTKISGGLAREHTKNWYPLRISATVEASNFKFGTQIWFGTIAYQKTTVRTKIGEGLG